MVHQSTRCKKLQRVFYCNLSKKVQSGAPSGDENSSGPPPVRRAKTPQWGVFRARESPRWCTRKSRNECCGFFVAPFPPGRTRTSRKRSCSSRGDWSLKMVAGLWAGATIERERKRGANNVRRARRTTARAVLRSKRNATVRRSLARGRAPGNVAGVERRGDGERQGLEIKKCKFARVFMATISLMVICCEIFSIEENWGKRRGEGTPPYGWGRVRCGFLMCRTAGRGVVG